MKKIQGDGGMLSKAVESLRENGKGEILSQVAHKKPILIFNNVKSSAKDVADAVANASNNAIVRATSSSETNPTMVVIDDVGHYKVEHRDPNTGEIIFVTQNNPDAPSGVIDRTDTDSNGQVIRSLYHDVRDENFQTIYKNSQGEIITKEEFNNLVNIKNNRLPGQSLNIKS